MMFCICKFKFKRYFQPSGRGNRKLAVWKKHSEKIGKVFRPQFDVWVVETNCVEYS